MISLGDIEAAYQRIHEAVVRSPCTRTERFRETGAGALFCKLENQQRTGSFKDRGALNKLLQLTPEERGRGLIAASAGNHAQAVAYHAGRLQIEATIVMPERTPLVKVTSTRSYGAKVVLHGGNFDEAFAEAERIRDAEMRTFIHAFDDPAIIAGQGTIALELMEQNPYLDMIVVPIGGGGLISGIAAGLKELNPRVKIIGVQAASVAPLKASFDSQVLTPATTGSSIADGIAVKRPGVLTFEHIQRYVDDIVTVDEEEIANAILLLLEREKTVVEGAGAVPLAALLNGRIPSAKGKKVAMLLSGGNIDVTLVSRIIERGLVKDGRMVRLIVRIPDRPGGLAALMAVIAQQGANVMDIFHNRIYSKNLLGEVAAEITLETRGTDHVAELTAALTSRGYAVDVQSGPARGA